MLITVSAVSSNQNPNKPEDLYREYASWMIKAAYGILQDKHLAQGAVQEAFINIFRYFEKIVQTDRNKTGAMFVIIVRKTAMDICRKRRGQTGLSVDEQEPESHFKPNIEKVLMNSELLSKATEKIKQLPPLSADILAIKYFFHYQDKEIARILNLSPELSRARLQLAEESLLNLLSGEQKSRSSSQGDPATAPIKEKMLEILFAYAAACHVENIIAEYSVKDGLTADDTLSPELERRMKKNKIRKALPKAAIFLLVLLGSFTIVVASVEALRVKALNMMLSIQDRYTSVQASAETFTPAGQSGWKTARKAVYEPGYIPPGFQVEQTEQRDLLKEIRFRNEQGRTIRFTQYFSSNTDLRIDTENAKVEQITIHDSEAVLVEKQGLVSIVWREDYLLYLIGEADQAEIIKMAEGIRKSK